MKHSTGIAIGIWICVLLLFATYFVKSYLAPRPEASPGGSAGTYKVFPQKVYEVDPAPEDTSARKIDFYKQKYAHIFDGWTVRVVVWPTYELISPNGKFLVGVYHRSDVKTIFDGVSSTPILLGLSDSETDALFDVAEARYDEIERQKQAEARKNLEELLKK